MAQRSHTRHIMAHEEHRSTLALRYILHLTDGFLLELGVTDGEDLVHDQDLGIEMGGDGEAQTDHHTATVPLNRRVDIALATGEIDDLVQLTLDLIMRHAQDSAVEENILPTRHLAMETCTDLQQATYPTMRPNSARRGTRDATEKLEQGGLTRTVLTDDTDDVALLDVERDVTQCPDVVGGALRGAVVGLANLEVRVLLTQDVRHPEATDIVCQGPRTHQSQPVLLTHILKFNCICHIMVVIFSYLFF